MFSVEANEVTLDKGAYSIEYDILHGESKSVSIANDYFEKPALIFVEDDETYVQLTLNHSYWTKELQAPLGDTFVDVDVISEDKEKDTRKVEFLLDEYLSELLEFKMHVLIETMEPVYDHRYTVRVDFDEESIEQLQNEEREMKSESISTEDEEVEEQKKDIDDKEVFEKSYNNGFIWIIIGVVVIILLALTVIIISKRKKNKDK